MNNYRSIVHYHFKMGWEEKGMKWLENELLKAAHEYGNHTFELCYNEKDPGHVIGMSWWNTFDEAHKFQSRWAMKERELLQHCMNEPKREFYKLRKTINEKSKKAA